MSNDQSKMALLNGIMEAWINCAPDADRVRSSKQNLWDAPDVSDAHILTRKKEKKILNLQVFSQTSKTMKKLQAVPNTIMNTSLLVVFW